MSRVIKAAYVQFNALKELPCDEQLSPLELAKLRQHTWEEAEQEARIRLEKAENEAAEILAKAENRAKQIVADAESRMQTKRLASEREAAAEAEQARAQAFQEGYEDGLQQGLDEGRRQAAGSISAAAGLMLETQARVKQTLSQSEERIIELATALARRIIGQELITAPDAAVAMAHQMLQQLEDTPAVVLRVAREILPLYRERLERARQALKEMVEIEILGDPLLSTGDFLIDTPSGTVDGRIDAQLDVLRKALLNLSRERAGYHE